MSRLHRPPKPPRHPHAPLLSPEQEEARLAQSKRDRKKIVRGLLTRRALVTRNGLPVWQGLVTPAPMTRERLEASYARSTKVRR